MEVVIAVQSGIFFNNALSRNLTVHFLFYTADTTPPPLSMKDPVKNLQSSARNPIILVHFDAHVKLHGTDACSTCPRDQVKGHCSNCASEGLFFFCNKNQSTVGNESIKDELNAMKCGRMCPQNKRSVGHANVPRNCRTRPPQE